ncbi:integrase domain-containing protein [Lonsdalea quercina]|uniref:integrase domain-containing protein n=1 Tax=Lonsdalea quercina TaxID=71657 RepID=UPI0039771047
MSKLSREMTTLAKQAGGSYKTVHDRIRIMDKLCRHLLALNIQVRDVKYLKARHIESYIAERLSQRIAPRTLHNEMAALRTVFKLGGREKLAASDRLTNNALGLSGASRAGTKFSIPDERYQAVLLSAQQRDKGLACALQLARLLGLRSQEAVQCASSLKTWEKQLERHQQTLTVVFGTKGGRPRETRIIDREAIQRAVKDTLKVAEARNGRLIDKPDLKTAYGMPVRLIILDTLARCFGGSDENAAKDMGVFIQGCDAIKAATQATVLIIHHSGKDQDKGARGSSAFRAALDVEFNVRREGDGAALILSCTKMKDAEEPPRRAYDLNAVNLYVDDDGDQITSLVLNDEGREVREDVANDPDLAGISRLTENHVALWQAIRFRTSNGEGCTRSLVRDDMRAMGFDVNKKFTRWLDKLEKDGLIAFDEESITPLSQRNKVGD